MLVEKVRKNSKPKWYDIKSSYCLNCGKSFSNGETILSGMFCSECGPKKERELKIDKENEVYWIPYYSVCVKCAKPMEEKTLFGIYCKKCGKLWEKERKLRQARLKKACGF
jgi:DNA-directed RNA polymerase subunit RPC12/RpoP